MIKPIRKFVVLACGRRLPKFLFTNAVGTPSKEHPIQNGANDFASQPSKKHVERSAEIKKPGTIQPATAAASVATAEGRAKVKSPNKKETASKDQAKPASSSERPAVQSPTRRKELQKELPTSLFIPAKPQPRAKRSESGPAKESGQSISGSSLKAPQQTMSGDRPVAAKQGDAMATATSFASKKVTGKNVELERADSKQKHSSHPPQLKQPPQQMAQQSVEQEGAQKSGELSKQLLEEKPMINEGPRLTPIEKARLRMQGKLLPPPRPEQRQPQPSNLGMSRKVSNEKHEARPKQNIKPVAEKGKPPQKDEGDVKLPPVESSKQLGRAASSEPINKSVYQKSEAPQQRVDSTVAAAQQVVLRVDLVQSEAVKEPLENNEVAAEESLKLVKAESRNPVVEAVKTVCEPALLEATENHAAQSLDRAGTNANKPVPKKTTRIGGSVALQSLGSAPPRQDFSELIGSFGAISAKASEQLARSGAFMEAFCPTVAVTPPEFKATSASSVASDLGNTLSSALGYNHLYSTDQCLLTNGLAASKPSRRAQELGAADSSMQFAAAPILPFADLQSGPPGLQGKTLSLDVPQAR